MLLRHLLTFHGKEATQVNEAAVDNILDLLDYGAGVVQMPVAEWPKITGTGDNQSLDLDQRETTLAYLARLLQTENAGMERSIGINPDVQPAAVAVQPAAVAVQPAAAAVKPKRSRSPAGRVRIDISERKRNPRSDHYSHVIAAFACAETQLQHTVRTHATLTFVITCAHVHNTVLFITGRSFEPTATKYRRRQSQHSGSQLQGRLSRFSLQVDQNCLCAAYFFYRCGRCCWIKILCARMGTTVVSSLSVETRPYGIIRDSARSCVNRLSSSRYHKHAR
jgi:hypothetical protein